ncbi:hypothetical protein SmJEL517_g00552 [Synchytrium microbalum]|uniref:tRNA (guanine(37)-N1)-methyltransferase n=1 Tax=Synchytrium microbalum TaxID=1806994 RepID=A0A507CIV2_9FUNG|nr:uncharacterized protein SmJEL517_g00552 [Synchytrium microbalum]TPX37685.1 hypothetical protein SmJEL517_g00552 [Synchytrium microbalum]
MPVKPPSLPNTTILNKELFSCIINVTALRIPAQRTSQLVAALRGTVLREAGIKPVIDIPSHSTERMLLLDPDVVREPNVQTMSQALQQVIAKEGAVVTPYELHLTYEDWTFEQVIRSVLPTTMDVPSSFEGVGHIAHFNLRDDYLPYKNLIGQVLLDKNRHLRTVVNKLDSIDHTFRFFKMEVLAGDDDFMAEVHESNCKFRFDFSKVYWNSRLQMEHSRLLSFFKPGDIICDAFAGVGPFAIPAAKNQKCTVFASDLNPNSYEALAENVQLNKVEDKVAAYNMDAREFFAFSLRELNRADLRVSMASKAPKPSVRRSKAQKTSADNSSAPSQIATDAAKKTEESQVETNGGKLRWFNHYVMNLPAAAVEFLDAFRGLLSEYKDQIPTEKLPIVHCYLFTKGQEEAEKDAVEMVSKNLGTQLLPSDIIKIHRVRDVSPKKEMFCVSFRLPALVAFADK